MRGQSYEGICGESVAYGDAIAANFRISLSLSLHLLALRIDCRKNRSVTIPVDSQQGEKSLYTNSFHRIPRDRCRFRFYQLKKFHNGVFCLVGYIRRFRHQFR